MTGVKLTRTDLMLIRTIDTAWFAAQATERDRQSKTRDSRDKAAPARPRPRSR